LIYVNQSVNVTTMKTNITQSYIAKRLGVSRAFINYLVNGSKRPNWKRAKELSKITGSKPELWLEGTPEQIKTFLKTKLKGQQNDRGDREHEQRK